MLAVFAIRYLVDQVVLGVVLNVFASGLTGFLYDRALVPYQNSLNSPSTYLPVKIPLLGDIPIIGPVFFDSTIFLYITYVLLILVQVGLFSTRWGLRVRAVGEHPMAADTVGIRVLGIRYTRGDHGRPDRRHRRHLPDHRVERQLLPGHVLGHGLHRAGRADLRPVDAASERWPPRCCSASPRSCSQCCPRSTCRSRPTSC